MKCLAIVVGLVLALPAQWCAAKSVEVEAGGPRQAAVIKSGVSQRLAAVRGKLLADVHYRLHFDIPADQQAPIPARVSISFELAEAELAKSDIPLQLDFRQEQSSLRSLHVNGNPVEVDFRKEHIVLPASALSAGGNRVDIEFVAGDSSLNRNPGFLYTLFVPDRARTAFPLFDQPDLKARFELSLSVPAGWRTLANAPLRERVGLGAGRVEYRYHPSDLISSYLFSFVAGEFQVLAREVNGRSMTMLHRETDAAKVVRNADAIFDLHGQSIAWLEEYTGIAYPFQKFDFVLIPGFPYRGMEHVGAIQYRASKLLLDEEPPLTDSLGRAQLIAHETAHMWFGNLVTMRWFDDVWTKEVFANFIADKIVNPAFPDVDHALNFQVSHYPQAYAVDRSEGANPIRQPLSNLNQAGQLYGDIIYHKAPIMMRQLELIVGEAGLREGLAKYLREFSYGNATWPQLIGILDAFTDIDLAAWSDVWVNTAGRPEFALADGGSKSRRLLQDDPAGEGRVWPQQFDLLRLYPTGQSNETLFAVGPVTPLPAAVAATNAGSSLLNADGRGYGLFPTALDILLAWDRMQPVQRGAALINTYENLLAGDIVDVGRYHELLLGIVQREQDPLLLELALEQMQFVYQILLDAPARNALADATDQLLWTTTISQPDSSRTKLLFGYYAAMVSSPDRLVQLYEIWSGTRSVDKLVLEEQDRIELAEILAIRLPGKSSSIVTRQLAAIENPDRRRRLAFIAPSLSADEAERDAFFESLRDEENRRTESWVSEAVARLHHPTRLRQSEKYLLPSLELLQEIQVTGDIFFPSDWLHATLGNHHSATAAQAVRRFLARRPDYSPQLRMKILQAADGLFRAAAMRGRYQSVAQDE